MNIAELFKKNFVLVPVIASVLFGTFTGVKYIVNLTDTINTNQLAAGEYSIKGPWDDPEIKVTESFKPIEN